MCMYVTEASRPPTASPMGLRTFFLFWVCLFFPSAVLSVAICCERKQRIVVKFWRPILMYMLQVEVKKNGFGAVIFNSVI